MKGVKFLYDAKGVPEAVLIDLKKNPELWEAFGDLLVAKLRRNEPHESMAEVTALLAMKSKAKVKK